MLNWDFITSNCTKNLISLETYIRRKRQKDDILGTCDYWLVLKKWEPGSWVAMGGYARQVHWWTS